MAATFVTVTNLTATTITVSGDEGKPVVTIGHTAGANTATISMGDLLGNVALCTTLAAWITAAKVSITRGSVTLSAANLTAYAQGSDMNRANYDTDDDGIVDSAESINFASVTAETALAVGDSFLLYDLSAAATRKFTVPNALNISVLTAETAVASDDSVLLYDLSNTVAKKIAVSDLLNVSAITAEAAADDADSILIWDSSAGAARSQTRANFFNTAILQETDLQAVAATATTTSFIARSAGTIKGVLAKADTAAAAGESMTVDVAIGGVSALTAVITLDDASGVTVVTGTVDAAADDFVAGDVITVVRTYVAGGGPTPMADTHVSIWAEVVR